MILGFRSSVFDGFGSATKLWAWRPDQPWRAYAVPAACAIVLTAPLPPRAAERQEIAGCEHLSSPAFPLACGKGRDQARRCAARPESAPLSNREWRRSFRCPYLYGARD